MINHEEIKINALLKDDFYIVILSDLLQICMRNNLFIDGVKQDISRYEFLSSHFMFPFSRSSKVELLPKGEYIKTIHHYENDAGEEIAPLEYNQKFYLLSELFQIGNMDDDNILSFMKMRQESKLWKAVYVDYDPIPVKFEVVSEMYSSDSFHFINTCLHGPSFPVNYSPIVPFYTICLEDVALDEFYVQYEARKHDGNFRFSFVGGIKLGEEEDSASSREFVRIGNAKINNFLIHSHLKKSEWPVYHGIHCFDDIEKAKKGEKKVRDSIAGFVKKTIERIKSNEDIENQHE